MTERIWHHFYDKGVPLEIEPPEEPIFKQSLTAEQQRENLKEITEILKDAAKVSGDLSLTTRLGMCAAKSSAYFLNVDPMNAYLIPDKIDSMAWSNKSDDIICDGIPTKNSKPNFER